MDKIVCFKCGEELSWERVNPEDSPEAEVCFLCGNQFCPKCIVWAAPYNGECCKKCVEDTPQTVE
jgi:hypothetical protein